jgi:hypothetical protein
MEKYIVGKIKSNLVRCPYLKIKTKEIFYGESGEVIKETIQEEFQDCYKTFCAAWDKENNRCNYLFIESSEEDDE